MIFIIKKKRFFDDYNCKKGNSTSQFQDQMMHLLRSPRNWAKGVIFWNIALDQVGHKNYDIKYLNFLLYLF